jgi:hypothetical protein
MGQVNLSHTPDPQLADKAVLEDLGSRRQYYDRLGLIVVINIFRHGFLPSVRYESQSFIPADHEKIV